MNSDISAKTLWDCGGKGGLILGGVTIGFMLLNLLVGLLPDSSVGVFLSTVLNFILWGAKLFCCIYVLYALMRKFTLDFPGSDRKTVRKYGVITGFTSAILVAAFSLVYYLCRGHRGLLLNAGLQLNAGNGAAPGQPSVHNILLIAYILHPVRLGGIRHHSLQTG